jgi:hypothetical protein
MTTTVAGTATRIHRNAPQDRARRATELAREARMIKWAHGHLTDGCVERRHHVTPEWAGQTHPIALAGPWKNRERGEILAAWGIPAKLDGLDSLPLLPAGGYGVFGMPPRVDVYAFIAKAAKHTDSCTYLHLIAQVALHSQWVLSEALVVVADCMALDPRPGLGHPREAANDWALVGIQAANVWEARTNGGGVWLGDVERINELVRALSKQCAQWQIMQEELSLSDRKAAFTRRYAAREVTA